MECESHEKVLRKNCSIAYDRFLFENNLNDVYKTTEKHPHFCHYECSPIFLMEALVDSKEILPTDYVYDIGCGTGIFLFFLATQNFMHLHGIEYNPALLQIAKENQNNWRNPNNVYIEFIQSNALNFPIPDNANVFYLFNTFLDEDTYTKWLRLLSISLKEKPRKIKIILLLPTDASMNAFKKCSFLNSKKRLKDERQWASDVLYFLIFSN